MSFVIMEKAELTFLLNVAIADENIYDRVLENIVIDEGWDPTHDQYTKIETPSTFQEG